MVRLRPSWGVCLLLALCARTAESQILRTEPDAPAEGSLFRIVLSPAVPLASVNGTVAGEPVHFELADDGALVALAAAPLDAGDSVHVRLVLTRADGRIEKLQLAVPVLRGRYPLERLTVAPRFGAPPDSATAARIALERERARHVSTHAHDSPRVWTDVVLPRDSRITSGFGGGREFNGVVQSRHTGTDFAGPAGAPVHAAARGVVALVDEFHLAGNVVYLDHGAGLVTAYFHLSRALVAQGDTVAAGQEIGLVGATGRVTGPHLHWVVRYGSISVDPLGLLSLGTTSHGTKR
jgi:murein DD-endopeptidase MepM/ murein hydrolase activator NlpD